MSHSESPPILLSICVPTFNRAAWLRSSLTAWVEQAQKFPNVEVVVSDNASDDETPAIIAEVATLGPLVANRNPQNIGGNPNFYKLVAQLARGKWVWVVGDDDLPFPDAVERVVTALEANPDAEFVFAPYQMWWVKKAPETLVRVADIRSNDAANISSPISETKTRRVDALAELVGVDSNCFTPIYMGIWPRERAVAAFEGSVREWDKLFVSVESVSSHAIYVAQNLLQKPAFYLGEPVLLVSTNSTWPEFGPIYHLNLIHEIYDAFEQNGISRQTLDPFRRHILQGSKHPILKMLFDPKTAHREHFSLWRWFWRHKRFAATWKVLLRVLLRLVYKDFFATRKAKRRAKRAAQGA